MLSDDDGMRLVGLRGRAMAEAAAAAQTGMSAIIGGDRDAVLTRLGELDLTPANHNGAGQIVAAGTLDALATLVESPVAGTRVIPLQVAGAFHTRFMAPAVDSLRAPPRRASRHPTPLSPSGRTATASRSPRAAARSTCSSRRSPRPCAGTSAWNRSPPTR